MLPSKGYFRSIDCPFYKNNLCHRFYCHFRHNKKESLFSSDSDTVDNSCDDSPEVCRDVLKKKISCNQNSDIRHHASVVENIDTANVNLEINKNKVYSLPTDIPQYNPTPISELKTRHKQIIQKSDQINPSDFSCNQSKDGSGKDSNLIETLVGYFIDNNTTFSNPVQSKKVEDAINSEANCKKKCISEKLDISACSTSIADSTSTPNNRTENTLPASSINSIVQENMKLKEMISQLKNTDSLDKPKSKTEVLDNQTLLEDLMGNDSNTESNKKMEKIGSTEISDERFIKESYMNCEKYSSKRYEPSHKKPKDRHKCERKIDNKNLKEEINKKVIKTIRKSGQIRDHSKQMLDENSRNKSGYINGIIKEEISDAINDPEVILISDSEDVDDCTVFDKNIENKIDEVRVNSDLDYLTEPKRKIRISRITHQNSSLVQRTEKPHFSRSHDTPVINESENIYVGPKQKVRVAHKLNYRTLSVQSLEDHVSHWESVKERVKHKCINPSGEAGYQNWSKVKISPVPNVTSLINSKKLLYSKIHQWKSKAKF